ncbi:MAG TPA: RAMP superfamily CRISPR-associated protein [Chloroflexota bacterium]|nr:RAMP superfamily CRISPR-associated protein [Chloroflexota bacterium]
MPRVEVALAVTVHGALATGVGSRDARDHLVLRGSQIKGRLRQACEQVARSLGLAVCRPPAPATMCPRAPQVVAPPCVVCALFGAPPWPSPLRWRDLRAVVEPASGGAEPPLPPFARAGVALDRRLGVAVPASAYLVKTSPPLPADGLRFASESAITGSLAEAALLQLLLASCRLLDSVGAGETRGLGWSVVEATARLDGQPVAFEAAALGRLTATSQRAGPHER